MNKLIRNPADEAPRSGNLPEREEARAGNLPIRDALREHAEALAREVWGDQPVKLFPLKDRFIKLAAEHPPLQLGSIAPWLVGFVKPNGHKAALKSLRREGFEVFYPKARHVTTPPLRTLTASKRRNAHLFAREVERPAYGAYIFLRSFQAHACPIASLHELPGVGGVCRLGECVVQVADFEIELMRVAEARGVFDRYSVSSTTRYQLAPSALDGPTYHGTSRLLVHRGLDESGTMVQFVEELGRIIQIIEAAG